MRRTKRANAQASSQAQPGQTNSQKQDVEHPTTIDELREAIQSLADEDRLALFESLCVRADREVIVLMHDWETPADKLRPRAEVIFSREKRQMIDILASVKANAASIAHPAIVCAVRRWERIVICQTRLPRIGTLLPENSSYPRDERSGLVGFAEMAEDNLRRIGGYLLEGAKNNAWPKEYAFETYRSRLFDSGYDPYLRYVFEARHESQSQNVNELVEMALRAMSDACTGGLNEAALKTLQSGFEDVRVFLQTATGGALLAAKRHQWAHWLNLFDEWRFPRLQVDAQRTYKREGRRHIPRRPDAIEDLQPLRNYYNLSTTDAALNLPVLFTNKK